MLGSSRRPGRGSAKSRVTAADRRARRGRPDPGIVGRMLDRSIRRGEERPAPDCSAAGHQFVIRRAVEPESLSHKLGHAQAPGERQVWAV